MVLILLLLLLLLLQLQFLLPLVVVDAGKKTTVAVADATTIVTRRSPITASVM